MKLLIVFSFMLFASGGILADKLYALDDQDLSYLVSHSDGIAEILVDFSCSSGLCVSLQKWYHKLPSNIKLASDWYENCVMAKPDLQLVLKSLPRSHVVFPLYKGAVSDNQYRMVGFLAHDEDFLARLWCVAESKGGAAWSKHPNHSNWLERLKTELLHK